MAMRVDPGNAEAFKAWDGDEGAYWTRYEHIFAHAQPVVTERLFEAAAIAPTDAVLDIGCGSGATTRDAARRASAGHAVGVDLSSQMLALASKQAADEGITNVEFEQADAQVASFAPASFDVEISRYGVMFFDDAVEAFTNMGRALKPSGRLAMAVWRPLAEQEWFAELTGSIAMGREIPTPPPGAPGPFALADPARTTDILTEAGFTGIVFEELDATLVVGYNLEEAFTFVSGLGPIPGMLNSLDDSSRAEAVDKLRASLDSHTEPDAVRYRTAVWIISAHRNSLPTGQ
jgi:SAM-dependent methyltransferase